MKNSIHQTRSGLCFSGAGGQAKRNRGATFGRSVQRKIVGIVVALVCVSVPGIAENGENLFENGDMNSTTGWKWAGHVSYETIDSNRVLQVTANPRREISFYQVAITRKLNDVTIRFKYMATDYKGRGILIRGVRSDGSSTFMIFDPVVDGTWQEYDWHFRAVRRNPRMRFYFVVMEGEGTVYFDDFVVLPE